ncbi:MAG: DUF362 domain-containing protein [Deltaproteobacteria bacterium]|nr:DUF362 domain-containing protein [Deltaproteobacteria bacterium]
MNDQKTDLTRRQFLKATAVGLAAGLAGLPAPLAAAAEEVDLAVISGEPAQATRRALEALGGFSRFVKRGQRVVIKPNMSFARSPEFAATTHPQVVASLARGCVEAGASEVLVLDHTLQRAELCLDRTGIRDACRGIPTVQVLAVQDRRFFREIRVPQGKVLQRVEVVRDILDDAVLISVPVAKSHSTTGVSLGLKGLMGLIWERESFHAQFDISQGIADLATVIRPRLTVLDATRALASGGPGGPGDVKKPNLVVAGTDPVAVDSYGVGIVPWYGQNFKGRQVEHLLIAHQRGLGKIDLEKLRIIKGTA